MHGGGRHVHHPVGWLLGGLEERRGVRPLRAQNQLKWICPPCLKGQSEPDSRSVPRQRSQDEDNTGSSYPQKQPQEDTSFHYMLRLPGLLARVHSALSLLYGPSRNAASLCPDPLWGKRSSGTPGQRRGGSRPAGAGLGALVSGVVGGGEGRAMRSDQFPSQHTHLGSAKTRMGLRMGAASAAALGHPNPLVWIL